MPKINAFRPVVHEKKSFNGFCYINLYKTTSLSDVAICDPRDFI